MTTPDVKKQSPQELFFVFVPPQSLEGLLGDRQIPPIIGKKR